MSRCGGCSVAWSRSRSSAAPSGPCSSQTTSGCWERLKRDIGAYLTNVWRTGALFGVVDQQAFYVKCDEELNPKEVRDAGQVIVQVGIAPVKPAEFVIIRIQQTS